MHRADVENLKGLAGGIVNREQCAPEADQGTDRSQNFVSEDEATKWRGPSIARSLAAESADVKIPIARAWCSLTTVLAAKRHKLPRFRCFSEEYKPRNSCRAIRGESMMVQESGEKHPARQSGSKFGLR
jgi:hypothetical protein